MSERIDSFCSGLNISYSGILVDYYIKERQSIQKRKEFENFLESNDFEEYKNFLEYKQKVEEITPNLKQIVYDWIDGKIKNLDQKYFTQVGLDLSYVDKLF